MSLIKQRNELDWPMWFGGRRLFDWPDTWKDLFEENDLRVEEYEDEGELVVRAEMPGIDPDEDVEITVSDRMLRLHAERRVESTTEDKKGYRSEFHYGSFSRAIRLPVGATEADVKATYVDGILEVRIPIDTSEAETKRIPISRT
ncbi:MAG: Hsp20/alpha crystallin family protein [Ilumatobacter sp.]|uniref:Hsp20/alpha crystallin family protein n=1 Tax=Ilumatobacter sp. TaxID=1967498 RepID=UPI00262070DB|nr:Hsp20/alpha crystallin family protein [Ilumatobacter sp.]MDJ0771356.1 Hsp20/alpha crystallin family protein [Ilumatobacter sp.]